MNFLTILYCFLFFLNVGLFSVQTNAEAIVTARNIFFPQTGLSEVSGNSKASFFFSNYFIQQISEITTSEVRNFSNITRRFPKSENLILVTSEETKWLGLLYLKENSKLTVHSKEASLSPDNQKFAVSRSWSMRGDMSVT